MYRLEGKVVNCFRQPASEKFPESFKVQIMGEMATQAGELRMEMLTLSATPQQWNALKIRQGAAVSIPVGLFVKGGALHAYIPKQAEIGISAPSGAAPVQKAGATGASA